MEMTVMPSQDLSRCTVGPAPSIGRGRKKEPADISLPAVLPAWARHLATKRAMAKTAKMAALGHLDGSNAETELSVKAILIASQRIEQVFPRMPKAAR